MNDEQRRTHGPYLDALLELPEDEADMVIMEYVRLRPAVGVKLAQRLGAMERVAGAMTAFANAFREVTVPLFNITTSDRSEP